jgi:hypothetical protein
MKRRSAAAALAIIVLWSSPALAWDPFGEDGRPEPTVSEPERDPDTAPFIAPPPDIYYVTDTYVADVVTSNGPLTTYSTSTIHESTGSYARVLESVATGVSSAFDGSAFNGRRALGDGRPVAGTYYENYVFTAGGFVPISIVFFQDDAELARLLAATPAPGVTTSAPSISSSASATARPLSPACCAASTTPSLTIASPTLAPSRPIRPGVSLLPLTEPLAMLEVLRGRAVALYPRVFVDDREVPVRSWSVVAGNSGDALATAGSGTVPFRTSWRRLAPPGAAYELVFRIDVEDPDAGHRVVDATISVVVRSPALED